MLNEKEKSFCRIPMWHAAGYTGKGIKIVVHEIAGSTIMNLPRYAGKVKDVHGGRFGSIKNTHTQGVVDFILTVAPDAEIHVVNGSTAQNLQYCIDNNIDLYNYSVDGGWNNPSDNALELIAQNNGTLFGCSAGNTGSGGLTTQARKPNWISAGACRWTTFAGVEGPFATYYSSYDSNGTDLDTMGFSDGIFIPDENGGWRMESGTSFAHPWVTGLLALWKQWFFQTNKRKPTYTEAMAFVTKNSHDLETPGYDQKTGYGLLRLPEVEPPAIVKNKLSMWIGSKTAVLNRQPVTLAIAPKIENGSTLVGFRDIAQLLGKKVSFDNAEKRIDVED